MSVREFIEVLRRPLEALPREVTMAPLPGAFDVAIRPPGSKSLTNRALLLAALAEGESELTGALIDADDAQVMIEALRLLGAGIEVSGTTVRVRGTGGRLRGNRTLNLKNAGTATRFLTAAACLADGPVVIDGNERMRRRPIGELVEMLRRLGVTVDELGALPGGGCVPVRVHPFDGTPRDVEVGATQSSQFISALCLIGPMLGGAWRLRLAGEPTSASYVRMTLALVGEWMPGGAEGSVEARGVAFRPAGCRGRAFAVEPDASGATYWWGAEAVTPGSRCAVPIDAARSLQSDAAFPEALRRVGGAVDLRDMPDAAMTLAAVACLAAPGETTTITGLRTLRVKETDRLEAIRAELTKVGARVEIVGTPAPRPGDPGGGALIPGVSDEGLRVTPPAGGIDRSPGAPRVVFETYDDHRMAMSLALIGLRRPNVVIRDPACVAKTYPTFWRHLSLLYESAAAGGRRVSSDHPR